MNNNNPKSNEILTYGILGIPIAFLGFPLYIYLPTFYVEYVNLSVGAVGLILLIARLMDMIIDPFIGSFIDKHNKFNIILVSSFFVLFGLFYRNIRILCFLNKSLHNRPPLARIFLQLQS